MSRQMSGALSQTGSVLTKFGKLSERAASSLQVRTNEA